MKTLITRLCMMYMLAVGPGAWSAGGEPEQLVRDVTDSVIQRLDSEPQLRDTPAQLVELIEKDVFPLVDFRYASRLTLANEWSKASEQQRQKFVQQMQTLLACTYASAFAGYSGERVEYLQPRWSEDREQVEIRTRITGANAQAIPVNYRLHKTAGGWKIYDLTVEGVSLVANYRATFRDKLQQQNLDALIANLAARRGQDCKAAG